MTGRCRLISPVRLPGNRTTTAFSAGVMSSPVEGCGPSSCRSNKGWPTNSTRNGVPLRTYQSFSNGNRHSSRSMSPAIFSARPGREPQTWGDVYRTIFGCQSEGCPRANFLMARASGWLKVYESTRITSSGRFSTARSNRRRRRFQKEPRFLIASAGPMAEWLVKSNSNRTPAAAIFGPPAPMNCAPGTARARALTRPAPLASPLGSPATTMMVLGVISIPLSRFSGTQRSCKG